MADRLRRIGIYSGTFDPVHEGHIGFALEALRCCNLHKIIFIPEEKPRGKQMVSDIAHRLEMLKIATEEYDSLGIEILPQKTLTTNQTLPYLQQKYFGAELTLLIGSDIVRTFSCGWPDLGLLLSSVELAVGLRGQDSENEVLQMLAQTGLDARFKIIKSAHAGVSSTKIRDGGVDGANRKVSDYIRSKRRLYRAEN